MSNAQDVSDMIDKIACKMRHFKSVLSALYKRLKSMTFQYAKLCLVLAACLLEHFIFAFCFFGCSAAHSITCDFFFQTGFAQTSTEEKIAESLGEEKSAAWQANDTEKLRPFSEIMDDVIADSYLDSAFSWRNKTVLLSGVFGQPLELNNFQSQRYAGQGLVPMGGVLLGVGLAYVTTSSTPSSVLLEETPIRQVGRPTRFEFALMLDLPLAEGAANQMLSILPAVQMMWSSVVEARLLYYDQMLKNRSGLGIVQALLSPKLDNDQIEELRPNRLPGMRISEDRLDVLWGLKSTVFHQSGVFLAPVFLISLPLFSGGADRSLGLWWEMTIGLGYAL